MQNLKNRKSICSDSERKTREARVLVNGFTMKGFAQCSYFRIVGFRISRQFKKRFRKTHAAKYIPIVIQKSIHETADLTTPIVQLNMYRTRL